jgi:glutathione synthase/RimK-type ligase-like ATP-grasp enzyme
VKSPHGLKVALVTSSAKDQDDFDDPPLREAFEAHGHHPRTTGWDDAEVDWARFDVALIRSTWDYFKRREEFLAWTERVGALTRLYNPPETVRWNTHKFYLRELASKGVPIVPTAFVEQGSRADLPALMEARGWKAVVIKPAVSADSFATVRAEREGPEEGQRHLDEHLPARDMLVQAYLPTVVEPGERCLIVIDGRVSHAVRKRSLFLGGRHAGPEGLAVPVAPDEADAARRVLGHLGPRPPLYARVDLLRDESGLPRLMELELVEPSLFFAEGPGSAERLVEAVEKRFGPKPGGAPAPA